MAVFNAAKREIDIKIVYYGPALCGKTTNVQCVHKMLSPTQRGDIMSLATKDDRTLFFDFLPIELGDVKGFKTRFHVYTVPGQVYYALTRRAVLTGVDGVVFVADSQASKMDENIESLQDLNENLSYYKKDLDSIPFVMQYNKRDLDNILPVAELNQKLNTGNVPYYAASAVDGTGVIETLTACCKLVLKQMDSTGGTKKRRRQKPDEPVAPPPPPPPTEAAPPQAAPAPASAASDISSFRFDDDDGPVIKIIAEDDAGAPSSPPPPPPSDENQSFPGFESSIAERPESPGKSGAGLPSLEDMPDLDAKQFETPPPSNAKSGHATAEEEPIPSFDAFEKSAPPAQSEVPEASSFDMFAKQPPAPDAEPAPSFESTVPSMTADSSSGSFTVEACGAPQKSSDTSIKLPVKLKHAQTGQTCSITVTVSFDDFSIS